VTRCGYPIVNNIRATTTRHNHSRWLRPKILKTKPSVFENHFFQIQTPSREKLETKFIVKIMSYSLKSFSCFSGGLGNRSAMRFVGLRYFIRWVEVF